MRDFIRFFGHLGPVVPPYRTVPLLAADALFAESDCTGFVGEVADSATSIDEMAFFVTSLQDGNDPNMPRTRNRCPIAGSVGANEPTKLKIYVEYLFGENGLSYGV
jgi:hypothetical protein